MKKLINLIFLLTCINIYSQWKYHSGNNDFDGSFKTASIQGSGGSFPYSKPLLVVNKFKNNNNINLYITNAGYSGCSSKVIYFKFDKDDNIYKTKYVESGKNRGSWFIDSFEKLKKYEFIDKLKKHSFISVRMNSNCGIKDYKFSLRGATKSLNYVLGSNWVKKELEKEKITKELKKKNDSLKLIRRLKQKAEKRFKDSIRKVEKQLNDSIKKIEKNKQRDTIVKKCKKYLKELSHSNAKCYVFTGDTVRERMQSMDSDYKIKKGTILVVDENFKNKVFLKVFFIETRGVYKYTYYAFKTDMELIK